MRWAAAGFAGLAVAVAAGAFGAHALKVRLDAAQLDQWLTAVRYFGLASIAVALLGALEVRSEFTPGVAAWLIAAGGLIFAVAVGGLALGAPRWFGAVAPIGGFGMILGLATAAWRLWRAAH